MKFINQINRGAVSFGLFCSLSAIASEQDAFSLKNNFIEVDFKNGKIERLSRLDQTDELKINDDVFEVLLLDDRRFTADNYQLKNTKVDGGAAKLTYELTSSEKGAPSKVVVDYKIDEGPYLFKDVTLFLNEGEVVDRLEVLRFSCADKAERGGMAQPVFAGSWFFGANYPAFHSRHSSDFVEPDFHYIFNFRANIENGARELAPRDGLISVFHFPGYAKDLGHGQWGIRGKQAVLGVPESPEDSAELGLMDYIEAKRLPTRSYTHHNNWYTREAKTVAIENYVNEVAKPLAENLARYGAKLDAMVPDNGWQVKSNFETINQIDTNKHDLVGVSKALRELGIDFGIWIGIDGTTYKMEEGAKAGYRQAMNADWKHTAGRWGGKPWFNILDAKYQSDYRKATGPMLTSTDARYIKHDFNHMLVSDYLEERHAREACFDATLDLIAWERELAPELLVNFTNGSFFSPFYFLFFEYIWMNSGDSGSSGAWPQLCKSEHATTYRDNHFYQSFNNPERCVRPLITIGDFMTHGVLHSGVRYFEPEKDPIRDFMNYMVMYYGRGTLLKELYVSPSMMTEEMWKALGTSTAWAQKNEDRMEKTVFVGGDSSKGEVYGYTSWNAEEGFLCLRNPSRKAQTIEVPIDRSVYYRGEFGQPMRARAVYPYLEDMPWALKTGKSFTVDVPGDSVLAFHIDAGLPLVESVVSADLVPVPQAIDGHPASYKLTIPDEDFGRYDLLLSNYHNESESYIDHRKREKKRSIFPAFVVEVDGQKIEASRLQPGNGWAMASYDLSPFRGKTVRVKMSLATREAITHKESELEAWLVVDRYVETPAVDAGEAVLPWAVHQTERRQSHEILARQKFAITE